MRTRTILTMALSYAASTVMLAALAAAATVEVKTKEGIGNYLTDEKGMTLYMFEMDSPGMSACAGSCVEKWPLFSAESLTVSEGLAAADFGVITREDGKKQTTYKGMPLYYFFKDTKAGDVAGQGVNKAWYVVQP